MANGFAKQILDLKIRAIIRRNKEMTAPSVAKPFPLELG
jgi:hypothetical protein